MILRFVNVLTGQVQLVTEGSRLHRLVGANPDGYKPIAEPTAGKGASDVASRPNRRSGTTRKAANSGG